MIYSADVMKVAMSERDIDYARTNPAQGFKNVITGQLRTLGGLALTRALGVPYGDFVQQQEAASEMGVAYVCELDGGKHVGIDPVMLLVKDSDAVRKNVVAPVGQLHKHYKLDDKYAVAVFVEADKNPDGTLGHVRQVTVAGWTPARALKNWVPKTKNPTFSSGTVALTVAPCQVVLNPIQTLIDEVAKNDARV